MKKNYWVPLLTKGIAIVVFFISTIGLTGNDELGNSFDSYQKEIDEWHQKRIDGLKREHGWLSLVALEWLHEGENQIESLATIRLKKGVVTISIDKNLNAEVRKNKFISGIVKPDEDKIVIDSRALMIIKRGSQYAARIWDSKSAKRTSFTAIERYPVLKDWKIEAHWKQYDTPKKITVETVVPGITEDAIVPGVAIFTIHGKEFQLEPTLEDSASYFFVFGDKTNGRETYGGGRFLYAGQPKDGKMILDFNKSYNPPCAFTEFATCPMPEANNRLSIRIEAGEKKYGNHK